MRGTGSAGATGTAGTTGTTGTAGTAGTAGAAGAGLGVGGGGVNLLALRSHNAALVLDLLRTAGDEGISRLELAERTGLTPQAVSKITARLREDGLVAEAGRRASTGGKPRTVLRLVPEAGHAVGVHLDRDEVRVVLVDLRGTLVGERRAALDLGAGAEAVLGAVGETVAGVLPGGLGEGLRSGSAGLDGGGRPGSAGLEGGLRPGQAELDGSARSGSAGLDRDSRLGSAGCDGGSRVGVAGLAEGSRPGLAGLDPSLLGVGVALPGPLDHARGVLHRVTGFPEWDGFPLRKALAERLGVPVVVDKDTNAAALGLAAGGESGSFAYLHLGTGLGAGLVIGGSVHRGARNGAGEFGHQVIQLDGPPCTCGNRGCVEALCLAAVARGDLAEAARVLGAGAANLVDLLDIDVVLLGGRTVAAAPEAFTAGVGAVLEARSRRTGQDAVPVRVAPGGDGAVAVGAAQLVLGPVFGRGGG
ncbi:Sugar kinase of the NBD/HSP70 family, may contain an N-terminal HTH domain [Streptomyces sp. Ag82_O1-12]|nr:Sugar kinase of the NBD/HSP70 family, may contain an N-terminal HTH domain [Streptomyces sp. Ag82_O1-12]SOD45587.1 Sugar kinase of the NBD/HSP70 family, may contain an N-terminal HTH domain [Streptomyces sp. Ag82_G6-1]